MAVRASSFITLTAVVDVAACYRYYLLQSSILEKPSVPTTRPPGGAWTDAEPSYTEGSTNSLYLVDLTVFSDGTYAYSAVSLSSSYEAAKEAWIKAEAAQNTADSANTTAGSAAATLQRALRFDAETGLHIGDSQTTNEVLIDSESVNIVMNGRKYSKFAANYVQFGNYQLRMSSDGGLVFKMVEVN